MDQQRTDQCSAMASLSYAKRGRRPFVTRAAATCWIVAGLVLVVGVFSLLTPITIPPAPAEHSVRIDGMIRYMIVKPAGVLSLLEWQTDWSRWRAYFRILPTSSRANFADWSAEIHSVPLTLPIATFTVVGLALCRWRR